MKQNDLNPGVFDAVYEPIVQFWNEFLEQRMGQTRSVLETMRGAGDLRAIHRRWLDSLAKSLDAYMRTPAFLEAMRTNLEVVTNLKAASEELAQQAAQETGIPRITDISGLFERVRIGQDAVLARLEDIEQQVRDLNMRSSERNGDKTPG